MRNPNSLARKRRPYAAAVLARMLRIVRARCRAVILPLGLLALAFGGTGCERLDAKPAPRDVLAQTLKSSVQIFTERSTGGRRAGSAVVIAELPERSTKLLVTTAHTLEPLVEQTITVVASPRTVGVPAQVIAVDRQRDLAFLEAALDHTIAPAPLSTHAYLVDPVWVIAFPWGRARTVVNGAVSQLDETVASATPIFGPVRLIDASASYGMSGGGIYETANGQLVGIVRGYRTADLALHADAPPLKLPIAGETTVVSSHTIVCTLTRARDEPALKAAVAKFVPRLPTDCSTD